MAVPVVVEERLERFGKPWSTSRTAAPFHLAAEACRQPFPTAQMRQKAAWQRTRSWALPRLTGARRTA